ncbi:LuxR C-terminal-related transcriptional regulator [Entomohabitans teleogrylli]|uniref:LuxR C-terminal-related transcriptional regulator n=1 Tax=Entomohabitans teleogrylli TaxID=1384589 RepID=UPI00073DB4B9|nr:LuxR C-terminal-related transcriptional regulator [Entomohabitans teleogrylli]
MNCQFFLYDKNVFFSEGVKSVIFDLFTEEADVSFSSSDSFSQLVNTLRLPEKINDPRWVLCDIESLPDERFNALNIIKELYSKRNQKLIVLLGENNVSLFFALHSLLPGASWLLKSETLENVFSFFQEAMVLENNRSCFSYSLVNYTRMKWLSRDLERSISSDDWWLMEEIFKGKTLSQISLELNVDVRRLSYHKRRLMKKLNAKNNVELFNVFKCIVATP